MRKGASSSLRRRLWGPWTPAASQRFVSRPAFDRADGHGIEPGFERAVALAQAILRADAPADLGQRIGLVHQLGRFDDASVAHELEPFRNAVVQRATPRAVRIAAIDAARGLVCAVAVGEVAVDLAITEHADRHRHLARQLSVELEEREFFVGHFYSTERASRNLDADERGSTRINADKSAEEQILPKCSIRENPRPSA